jgi:adenosylcobyric acid synthase
MVAGTSSWAGKSMLATALCASLHRRGLRISPFKAQNMSNNARVADGGEIGAAQYFQAVAAGVIPSVHHNPVLLKPEADTRSQVVVLGRVDRRLTEMPWRDRSPHLWDIAREAYDRVAQGVDMVVLEGAGSPAEVNLADVDIANLRIGRHAGARMIVVCDIDRGGAFAHLYGTWALLSPEDRTRVSGFVLNKFRGDPGLLAPGPERLEQLTGVPTIGVVPMVDHGLPDEDGADPRPGPGSGKRVRIIRGPAASNLDEWWPLREASDCRWATGPEHLEDAELVIVPGSKLPGADLAWMRAAGVDQALVRIHQAGVPILAVCGGAQVLGERIDDPHGVEGGGSVPGLGLLPVVTTLGPEKHVSRAVRQFRTNLGPPWDELAGLEAAGYEIHYGTTGPRSVLEPAFADGSGLLAGPVMAVYLHGLAENPAVLRALAGRRPARGFGEVVDGLADLAEEYLDLDRLLALV